MKHPPETVDLKFKMSRVAPHDVGTVVRQTLADGGLDPDGYEFRYSVEVESTVNTVLLQRVVVWTVRVHAWSKS